MSHKNAATTFLTFIATGKVREAFSEFVGADFIHHNPFFPGDRESLLNAMELSAQRSPHKEFAIKRVIEEGPMVMVHSHIRQSSNEDGFAVVHILRFDGGSIVELWDVGQPIPKGSLNKQGMF